MASSFVVFAVGAPVSQRCTRRTHRTRRALLAPGLHSLSLASSKCSRSVAAARRHQGIITCKSDNADKSAQVVTEVDEGESVVCTEAGVCMSFEELCEVGDEAKGEEKCGYFEVDDGNRGGGNGAGGGGGGGGDGDGEGEDKKGFPAGSLFPVVGSLSLQWQQRMEGALLLTALVGGAAVLKSAVVMLLAATSKPEPAPAPAPVPEPKSKGRWWLFGRGGKAREPAAPPPPPAVPAAPAGLDLYARFAFAGALCCAISHGALTPVDVIKTRMQLEPKVYSKGMLDAARQVVGKDGAGALLTGLGPTFVGYFLQGAFKFGGYEYFKKQWVDRLGPEEAKKYRTAIYLSSSACAEFIADLALCPLESTRIRLVANPQYANGLAGAAVRILKEKGLIKGFYSGFAPMLCKQVPYTMAKFVVFESLSDYIYSVLPTPKEQLPGYAMTCVNLGSGVGAGVVAAIISQPADTLLSKINIPGAGGTGSTFVRLVNISKELGLKGLFVGTGARCVMVGIITAGQFAIYGDIKKMLNATGGTDIAK